MEALSKQTSSTPNDLISTNEPYRPLFHFSPLKNWINDPNGLVFFEGEYHLFYQHHPESTQWGPMHWGHAVSSDLLHWQDLPIALYPDELGAIFSGSAVIDSHNSAGFGTNAMLAIFTHDGHGKQQQSLAYSTDKGRSWAKYAGNPVITAPEGIKDFRDPKVFWYGSPEEGHWVMVLAAGNTILFYTSPDLKNWQQSGAFGQQGSFEGVWETPDLFELSVTGTDQKRWVLMVAVGRGGVAGGSGQQYFVGQFNGQSFINANEKELVLWADYGADFYAGQSWDNVEGRRIWIGWMNNWTYGRETPTQSFRGSMTIVRELGLVNTKEGIRLSQDPHRKLTSIRNKSWTWQNEKIQEGQNLLSNVSGEALEIFLEFQVDPALSTLGLKLRKGEDTYTSLIYEAKTNQLLFSRANSGVTDFHKDFSLNHSAPLSPREDGSVQLHLILDKSSVEVFANDGLVSMTEQIFPAQGESLELFVTSESEALITTLNVYSLKTDR